MMVLVLLILIIVVILIVMMAAGADAVLIVMMMVVMMLFPLVLVGVLLVGLGRHGDQLGLEVVLGGHGLQDLLTGQSVPCGGDDGGDDALPPRPRGRAPRWPWPPWRSARP